MNAVASDLAPPLTGTQVAAFRYLAAAGGHVRHLVVTRQVAGGFVLEVRDRSPNAWRDVARHEFPAAVDLNAHLSQVEASLLALKYSPRQGIAPISD